MNYIPSGSQTAGPFFNFALTADKTLGVLVQPGVEGHPIGLAFQILDGDGAPLPGDAFIELWQADARGRFADPHFRGFGRLETDLDGRCVFETIIPGSVNGQAPHICIAVFARGLLKQLYTRVYFTGDPRNDSDPVLTLVPAERRDTLLARPAADQPDTWMLTIRLQGENETVFFDL